MIQQLDLPFVTKTEKEMLKKGTRLVKKDLKGGDKVIMKKLLGIVLGLLLMCSTTFAIDFPLPNEPPVQVSGVEIVDGYTGLGWNANTESDLQGYIIGYSVSQNPAAVYVYDENKMIDVGNVTQFMLENLPVGLAVVGNHICFVVFAYDSSSNVSERSVEEVFVDYTIDLPPGSPTGVERQ